MNQTTPLNRKLLVLNGANLHLLGKREPHIYGTTTLQDIVHRLSTTAHQHGIQLDHFQSNHEGDIVDIIGSQGVLADDHDKFDGVIINPAAFTHTSVAIRDALLASGKPFIEVHLSNVHAREPFRSHSYFSDKAVGVICGLGDMGYDMALAWFLKNLYKTNGVHS
ncbi:type II 3-dehydroquinate dehydratase [Moraxella sp. K127]|uniref:3-dehydroquinate dehydratase n=1 Tax=Moraxella lacunata TaxID=477 RepID=A0A1V4H392_MORLA|nr:MULTISPECIES: type II 3-dehydroquinate dehydratase [Moraxella]MBE9591096.1 type II 3-dehydroquinate dehydratase [Moraxella sp. K127]OPH39382.1 type II 3-dehydroquinate dehydratase [Moraxella lacunata]STY99496.1 3-dehydroquinate dehydratase [Moraxella lacunata]